MRKKLILIVDDEESNRDILMNLIKFHLETHIILEDQMPEIIEATNGLEA